MGKFRTLFSILCPLPLSVPPVEVSGAGNPLDGGQRGILVEDGTTRASCCFVSSFVLVPQSHLPDAFALVCLPHRKVFRQFFTFLVFCCFDGSGRIRFAASSGGSLKVAAAICLLASTRSFP